MSIRQFLVWVWVWVWVWRDKTTLDRKVAGDNWQKRNYSNPASPLHSAAFCCHCPSVTAEEKAGSSAWQHKQMEMHWGQMERVSSRPQGESPMRSDWQCVRPPGKRRTRGSWWTAQESITFIDLLTIWKVLRFAAQAQLLGEKGFMYHSKSERKADNWNWL